MLTHRAGDDLEGGDRTGGLVGEEFVDNESSERAGTDDGKGGRHFQLEMRRSDSSTKVYPARAVLYLTSSACERKSKEGLICKPDQGEI